MPDPVLWRISGYGRQAIAPATPYWWENRGRIPLGQCYAQLSVRGSIVHRDAQGEREVPANHLVLFRHGDDTRYGRPPERPATAYQCDWVALGGAGLFEHWGLMLDRFGPVHAFPRGSWIVPALHRLMDLARPAREVDITAQAAAVQAFVLRLYAELDARARRDGDPVAAAAAWIAANPASPAKLGAVAARHGVSREHLTRRFTAIYGLAPGAWQRRERVQRALALAASSALPLAAIAEQCGFPSPHALTRAVRLATGRPPSQHRT